MVQTMSKTRKEDYEKAYTKCILGETMHNYHSAAKTLGVSLTTIKNYVKQGKLRASKIGYYSYISEKQLKRMLGI